MRLIAVPVLTAALLGLTACGGDDEPDLADLQDLISQIPTSVPDLPDSDGASGDSGDAGDAGDAGEDDSGNGSGTGGDPSAFLGNDACSFVLTGGFANPFAGGFAPGSPTTPDFEDSADRLKEIADNAPSEIKSEFMLVAERFGEFAETFKDLDFSNPASFADPSVQAKFQDAETIFDDEFEAASNRVSDYFDDNCSSS